MHQGEFDFAAPVVRARLVFAAAPRDAWAGAARSWFERNAASAWRTPRPSVVLVPHRTHAQWLKAQAFGAGFSYLGIRFVTPFGFRESLSHEASAQIINLTLTGLSAGTGTTDVSVPMGVLLGDVNASTVVSNADVIEANAQAKSNAAASESNFKTDINLSGVISNADVNLIKAKAKTNSSLPQTRPRSATPVPR